MKSEIPSVEDFDIIINKKNESDKSTHRSMVEDLENKISHYL